MALIGEFISKALKSVGDDAALSRIADEVGELCRKFPVYPHRLAVS